MVYEIEAQIGKGTNKDWNVKGIGAQIGIQNTIENMLEVKY